MKLFWIVLFPLVLHAQYRLEDYTINLDIPLRAIPDCDTLALQWVEQAMLLAEQEQTELALAFSRQALEADTVCVQALSSQGWILFLTGERLAGFNQIRDLIHTYGSWPNLIEIQTQMALRFASTGPWWMQAGNDWQYIGRDPEFPGADSVTFSRHWYQEAMRGLEFLIQHTEEFQDDWVYQLCWTYWRLGEMEQVLLCADELIREGLHETDAWLLKAQVYARKQDWQQSLTCLQRAYLLDEENPAICQALSDVMRRLEMPEAQEMEARSWFYFYRPIGNALEFSMEHVRLLRFQEKEMRKNPDKVLKKNKIRLEGEELAAVKHWFLFQPKPPGSVLVRWIIEAEELDRVLFGIMRSLEFSEADEMVFFMERASHVQAELVLNWAEEALKAADERFASILDGMAIIDGSRALKTALSIYPRLPLNHQLKVRELCVKMGRQVVLGVYQQIPDVGLMQNEILRWF